MTPAPRVTAMRARWIGLALAAGAALGLGAAARPGPLRAQEEREPPPYELKVGGAAAQRAGVGTFCWIWGCVRKVGILTSDVPHVSGPSLSATLDLDYAQAPGGLAARLRPVEEAVDLAESGEGWKAWRPQAPGIELPLTPDLEQTLRLDLPPGDYVLSVTMAWAGEPARDVIYGFYLRFEAGPEPTPVPTRPTPAPPRLFLPHLRRGQ